MFVLLLAWFLRAKAAIAFSAF